MSREIESERTVTRAEAATVVREVAAGVTAGTLRISGQDEVLDVDVPEEVAVEVEFEIEEGERSVEVELEWPESEGEVRAVEPEAGATAAAEPRDSPVGLATPAESLGRFEVFRDVADEWRWRLVHRNGNVIATSGEGYTRKHNALKGARSVMQNAPGAEIAEEESDRDGDRS